MASKNRVSWNPAELHNKLNSDYRFQLLDLRNVDEFDTWRIEGKHLIDSINIPYFDLIDLDEEDEDIVEAVKRGVPKRLGDRLSKQEPILAVCAKGDTSEYVAAGLRGLGYSAFNLEGGMAAWGNHYEVGVVQESSQLQILQISRPARGCLSYIIASNQQAIIFDAGRHTQVYTQELTGRGWSAIGVLESHLQADHLTGGPSLAKALEVDYWLHPYDGINAVDTLPATFPYRYLQDGTLFQLGDVTLKVLHQPGHTLGMVNLLVDDHYLLTSDTLFLDSVGRPDLGGHASSWASLLYDSLQRIVALPDETIILPAHASGTAVSETPECYCSSLKVLRRNNESLRNLADGPDAFLAHILDSLPSQPESYDDIRRINSGLLEVDEIRMAELELGRNQCALEH